MWISAVPEYSGPNLVIYRKGSSGNRLELPDADPARSALLSRPIHIAQIHPRCNRPLVMRKGRAILTGIRQKWSRRDAKGSSEEGRSNERATTARVFKGLTDLRQATMEPTAGPHADDDFSGAGQRGKQWTWDSGVAGRTILAAEKVFEYRRDDVPSDSTIRRVLQR